MLARLAMQQELLIRALTVTPREGFSSSELEAAIVACCVVYGFGLETYCELAAMGRIQPEVTMLYRADWQPWETPEEPIHTRRCLRLVVTPELTTLAAAPNNWGRMMYDAGLVHWKKPSICDTCRNHYGQTHGGNILVCAIHPYGPEGQSCKDWEGKAKKASTRCYESPEFDYMALEAEIRELDPTCVFERFREPIGIGVFGPTRIRVETRITRARHLPAPNGYQWLWHNYDTDSMPWIATFELAPCDNPTDPVD
ncbi:MAG: hypothetical protein AAFV72_00350 [Cyanobacteria bacterium J06635_1]